MEIKAADIKSLREKTGAGMMECKKALMDSNGDPDAAEKLLKEKGLAAVAKRSGRATGEGRIFVKENNGKISIVELTCETDFVAKNTDFIDTGNKLAELTLDKELIEVTQEHKDILEPITIKIRENMAVRRADFIKIPENSCASTYVHHNFKIASIVVIKGSCDEKVKNFAHECCLHLAANTPSYIYKEDVPQSYIDEQTQIFKSQMSEDPKVSSKPDNVKAGILQGKVNKHIAEICFTDQMFIDDEKKTVAEKLKEMSKEVGTELSFGKIILYVLGK